MGLKSLQRRGIGTTGQPVKFSLLAVLLAVSVAFGSSEAWSAEQSPLLFLGDKDYPPVTYLENGEVKGMDVDLAKALSKPLKREVRVEVMDWSLAQEKVLRGEADGLLGLSISDARRQLYDFAKPTFIREYGFVVRPGEIVIRGGSDLKGKNVGVTAGGFPRKFMATQPGSNLILIDNYNDGFARLTNRTIDAIAADLWVAAYLIERDGIRGVSIVGKPFATTQGAIAVKKGNLALLNQINRAIETLEAEGTIVKIQKDWRPQEMLFASRQKIRGAITLAIGAFLIILIGVMASWIITLRKQIRVRKEAELALRQSEERFERAVSGSSDGIWDRNILTNEVYFSDRYRELLGYSAEDFPGTFDCFASHLHPDDKERVLQLLTAHLEQRQPYDSEHRLRTKSGDYHWFRARGQAIWDDQGHAVRMAGSITDITKRKRAEELIQTQRHVLEMMVSGKPMAETLDVLLRRVESQSPSMYCSILLLDSAGRHVRHCAAPSLPPEYLKAIDGSAIGPCAGSCGTAAFRREPVFVADIENDPLWADYRQFALPHELRACWSTPILDAQQKVLGTFAIYYRQIGLPNEHHQKLIEMAAYTAAICIAKHRAEEALRNSEESLRATIENTPGVAVQWYDAKGRVLFWNSASENLFGWKAEEALGKTVDELMLTSEEAVAFVNVLTEIARSNKSIGPVEYGFHRRDGSPRVCLSTIFQIPGADGQSRFVCMDVDVTERKAAEESMRQGQERELQARKEFAQQLIASQEAERRRIAGELHDSLGQNLSIIKNRAQLALSEKTALADSRSQLEAINDLVSQAIVEVRQISRDLHPYQIHHLGLTGAIKAMIETTADASEIEFQSKVDMVDECFSEEAAVNLYRIVQESLNNILKHSGAKLTRVELERDVHEIQLRIEDDGCGFNMGDEKNGLGLKNMAERVRILRGELKVDSQPKQGTRIEVIIPISEDKCL